MLMVLSFGVSLFRTFSDTHSREKVFLLSRFHWIHVGQCPFTSLTCCILFSLSTWGESWNMFSHLVSLFFCYVHLSLPSEVPLQVELLILVVAM